MAAKRCINLKKFHVTVFGGTNNKEFTAAEEACSKKLGKYLGEVGAEVLTGACRGFPLFVGREAIKHGAKVIGYSPAMDEKEHVEKYGFPLDGVTDMEYIKKDGKHQADNFLTRSWEMTPYSDVVIALGGSWGTYTELLFSFWYKKTIILVEGFGGAVEAFGNTHKFFGSRCYNPGVHYGATLISVKTVDEAVAEIEKIRCASGK